MRILVITNLYPPYYRGGYEIGCRDIVLALRSRGHEIVVLTSTYGVNRIEEKDDTLRWLETDLTWQRRSKPYRLLHYLYREWWNRRQLDAALTRVKPELVYCFNLGNTSVQLGEYARDAGFPTAYLVSDYWLAQLRNDTWYRLLNPVAGERLRRIRNACRIALRTCRLYPRRDRIAGTLGQFVSRYVAEETLRSGVEFDNHCVIHWGISPHQFAYRSESRPVKRFLFAGRLEHGKGAHTALEGFARVAAECPDASLTVLGRCDDEAYYQKLVALRATAPNPENVTFVPQVSREEMVQFYQSHDALLFSSIWPEPFSITVLEAMASGIAVVGTTTGGSREIVRHDENALAFDAGDSFSLSTQLRRLLLEEGLADRLRQRARLDVVGCFRFDRMTEAINESLERAVL